MEAVKKLGEFNGIRKAVDWSSLGFRINLISSWKRITVLQMLSISSFRH
jgi:hypothetical protein